MKASPAKCKIAYLVKTFPKISETFILREILALENDGVELEIFALRRPAESKTHAIASQVRAKVNYVPSRFVERPLALIWAQLVLLLFHPIRHLRALRFILRRRESARFKDFMQAGYLARLLQRAKLPHLHVHFINKPAGVAEIVRLLIGMPYSVTAHAKDIYLSPERELARKIATAKFVVTCTDHNRQFLQRIAAGAAPIVKIYHGLDLRLFRQNGAPGERAEAPLILSIGRLREKKGFPCLLDACRLLKIGGHRFRCVIVGYGPMRAALERRITELNLEGDVSLSGMLTLDEVIGLYRQATLFVLPCQVTEDGDRDGIPNVLAEAMAMELPVVSTDVSGIPELIQHMKDGLLVRPEDPTALAAVIMRLLDQPGLRRELGRAAREKVCRLFSAEHNAAQLKTLFFGAVGERADALVAPKTISPRHAAETGR